MNEPQFKVQVQHSKFEQAKNGQLVLKSCVQFNFMMQLKHIKHLKI